MNAQLLADMMAKDTFSFRVDANANDTKQLLRKLAERLEPVVYSPGDKIIEKGSDATEAYFIGSGIVRCYDANGLFLSARGEGECVGENVELEDA